MRITCTTIVVGLVIGIFAPIMADDASSRLILVETERFNDYGGWVHDSQFMDQMGSPFLLAHGLGVPVEDAATTVTVATPGSYRVWVRTRDWVAPWKAPGAPGRFQVLVDGRPLPVTFGTEGAAWHWQDGGTVEVPDNEVTLTLHDLTGFEGRCDAILLASDPDFRPPNEDPEMAAWRRTFSGIAEEPEDGGRFDLVVVGGGIAGTCAALSAARLDLKVALVQDRPVLGGNNSSEVRVWLQGARNVEPFARVGDVVRELEQEHRAHYGPSNTAEIYEDAKKLAIVRAEKNVCLMLNHRVRAAETDAGRVRAVIAQQTKSGRRVRISGRWFADCTGDGCVGFLAGADHQMTLEGHMGRCNLWHVTQTDRPQAFPRCPWALDLSDKPFPGREDQRLESLGGWYWESGFFHDPFKRSEYIRDWNFRAAYGAWDALKNVDGAFANHKLNWIAHIAGKRESRRLLGDLVLTKEDLKSGKAYDDGCVPTGWSIDLHLPDPRYEKGFEGDAFISRATYDRYPTPYWIPYRCLYSRNVPNLFMAGRDISVTHETLGSVRVMRTGGMMGEIVGMAASLCKRHDADPRNVYTNYLDELKGLMRRGVGRPPAPAEAASPGAALSPPIWLDEAGTNVARTATVTTSSSVNAAEHSPELINDGQYGPLDNHRRWLGDGPLPHQVELSWPKPQKIKAVRIITGYCDGHGRVVGPIEDFVLQYYDGTSWKEVSAARVFGNDRADWHATFPAVTAEQIRLLITKTHGDVSRIWEIELY